MLSHIIHKVNMLLHIFQARAFEGACFSNADIYYANNST